MIRFKRYGGWDGGGIKVNAWYKLRVWRLLIEFHRSDSNWHGANRTTCVKGWRLINLKRANGNHGKGHSFRIIKYWPSGSWWHVDVDWNRRHG